MGMVRTFQLTKVFDRMTVIENLLFSGSNIKNDSFLRSFVKLNSQKLYENSLREKANEIMNDLNIGGKFLCKRIIRWSKKTVRTGKINNQ